MLVKQRAYEGHGFTKVTDLRAAIAAMLGKIDGLAGFARQPINFPVILLAPRLGRGWGWD